MVLAFAAYPLSFGVERVIIGEVVNFCIGNFFQAFDRRAAGGQSTGDSGFG